MIPIFITVTENSQDAEILTLNINSITFYGKAGSRMLIEMNSGLRISVQESRENITEKIHMASYKASK